MRIAKPTGDEHAQYYASYIAQVRGDDAWRHMADEAETMQAALGAIDEARSTFRYAAGKWSIKQVVGHMIDAERVFGYRALTFARGDTTALPGMDQDEWMTHSEFDARPFPGLVEELRRVRLATLSLFEGFAPAAYLRTGIASGNRFSVRALAWIVAGHATHHMHVLRERYGVR